MPLTALVLAGSRPEADPLIAGTGLPSKALLPIAGRPMLAWVLAALAKAPEVGRIVVAAQDPAPLAADPAIAKFTSVEWHASRGSIADVVCQALESEGGPLLVTTADNVLLTAAMLSDFVNGARERDVAVAVVARSAVRAAGLPTSRTWLKFRGEHWSGANLFLLEGKQVLPLVAFWRGIEQDRKRRWKIVAAFGPLLLLGTLLRLIDIHAFARLAARRFGLTATTVAMPQAEACVDADKPADVELIAQILAARR